MGDSLRLYLGLLVLVSSSGCVLIAPLDDHLTAEKLGVFEDAGAGDVSDDERAPDSAFADPDVASDVTPADAPGDAPTDACSPHDDGFGHTWVDCVAPGTYTYAEALAACRTWLPFRADAGIYNEAGACYYGPSLETQCGARTVSSGPVGAGIENAAWTIEGPATGRVVKYASGSVVCPTASDLPWR